MIKRYVAALIWIALAIVSHFPSQQFRKFLYSNLFGMKLGKSCAIYGGAEIRKPWWVAIGAGSSIGHRVTLDGRGGLEIGKNVNISSEVMLWTAQHDYNDPHFKTYYKKITIEDWVWLGPRVIVLPGVTVAKGCVIAGGAVVTKDTEPFGLYGGIPAKRIGERSQDVVFDYSPGDPFTPFI